MTTTTPPTSSVMQHTLAHARRGDRKAFSRLVEPYRRELLSYCYRLVGTLGEAEDLVQEVFVRAFRAVESFEGRGATPRAWLYRIAHNLCLNHVQRRPPDWDSLDDHDRAAAPADAGREDVRLGFVALIQSLPPRQRAALVLRDVLGWSAEETARILETTVPAVKNALARARQTLSHHPHGQDPADVHDLAAADPTAQAIVADWVDAFEKGNTARMVALLTGSELGEMSGRSGYNFDQQTPAPRREKERGNREERTYGKRQKPQREPTRRPEQQ